MARRPEPRELPARAAQIIAAARELLESEGRDALTMRRLGQALGIRAPSIYKHLPGKHAVEVALMEAGFAEIGEALHGAVAKAQSRKQDGTVTGAQPAPQDGTGTVTGAQPGPQDGTGTVTGAQPGHQDGAIAALMAAYRAECLARPNLYRLTTTGRLPRGELTPGLEEWAGEPWVVVARDSYLAQAMWSFAHGMVILELDRRYPDGSDLDRTWRAGAEAFTLAARATAVHSGEVQ
ncbi:MAG TPA: TetR family transcriptional regulator [Streptosporangiaceae bacterium]|nr:TetR family transcriptional regulator [Streptosporangiaceae bacterium]